MKQFSVFFPTYSPDKYSERHFRVELVRSGTVTADNAKEAVKVARRKFGGSPIVEMISD